MNNPTGDKGRSRMLRQIAAAQNISNFGGDPRGIGLTYDSWTNTLIDYSVPYSPRVFMQPRRYGVGRRLPPRRALPRPPSRRKSASPRSLKCLPGYEPVYHPTWHIWFCGKSSKPARARR